MEQKSQTGAASPHAPGTAQTPDERPPLLSLREASAQVAAIQTSAAGAPVLHQYWDRRPPAQIEALLEHNARLCAASGIRHERWDLPRAEAFLADAYPDYLEVFRAVPHPAMGSDLLRLCVLARHGGLYLDADMALREEGGARLAALLQEGLVFKWTLPDRQNVPNWCFGFRAGHPMLDHIVRETAAAIATGLAGDRAALGRDILNASGPGRFTRAVGSWLAAYGCPPGFVVLDVDEAYKMVQNGPDLLRAPLAYKTTALHWLVAARGGGPDS